ncbi:hypothetical protein HO173_003644 [Letharia columbiana]|uniref:C2H2-type domain-containing protein n=1 Tax=Letharia columbiana TaxID=112416 RepID=A0A8H6G0V2_9LECA|nr:uncharacterized protein HO173_003644 [Letharia columbiana]KAF6238364.1 hypothetical protein HO173_003644 [Letharia columbiana]
MKSLSDMSAALESNTIAPSTSIDVSGGVTSADSSSHASGQGIARPHAKSLNSGQNANPNFPPPKTDKPRPHVCATCTRSFARLEHLKRHERSHTKEKPFACPECTRCFARRDLLLRHQQKLHLTALPPSRQRGARRESTSSAAPGGSTRVRKNSMANNASGTTGASAMRPRANTISHVDGPTLGLLAAANSSASRHEAIGLGLGHHGGINGFSHGLPGVGTYPLRGMSSVTGHHGNSHVLPKLETKHQGIDIGASLRTAPPFGGFGGDIDMDSILYGPGTTVNPAQLHFSNSPQNLAFDMVHSPYHQGFSGVHSAQPVMDNDGHFTWMNNFDHQMSFQEYNEQAIDGSSPSAISTGSPDGMNEVMLDGSNNSMSASGAWPNASMSQAAFPPAFSMDLSAQPFPDLCPPSQLSPKSLNTNMGNGDQYFSSPPPLSSQTPISLLPGLSHHYFHPSMNNSSDTPSNSAASISSSNRQSSVTSVSTDSITDATRQALLTSLSQPSMFRQRKTSHPQVSSPLSPVFSSGSRSISSVPLPSTYDLQRYVAAYIQYFHPHLPFLHIPSLSFDSPAFTSSLRASSEYFACGQSSIAGGGGSLILAMAAIGALYEYDLSASKELFEMAKKMIHLYLEERRKADMSAALNGNHGSNESYAQNTPLWLVQAMLLNVIYGHNCGDKTAAGIASTHCAALVSLARAAELTKPVPGFRSAHGTKPHIKQEDAQMGGDEWNGAGSYSILDAQNEWHYWKLGEECKRTLYAVFILSSLLVSAYNHAPALMNSEIGLDLPCDEGLWAADSAETWHSLGGATSDQRSLSFASALSSLLTASQRSQQGRHGVRQACDPPNMKFEDLPESDIRPSTFGCLILINALHNYIWETRQRHMGRQWTPVETQAMHDRIKPALKAWQAAWSCNPEHSIERPNPFGASSLSADCIPLLDLAYVRLYVNLGRSKEAFFRRDFDTMADELGCGNEFVQHAGHSPRSSTPSGESDAVSSTTSSSPSMTSSHIKLEGFAYVDVTASENPPNGRSGECTTREKQLFLAAELAVNALIMANNLGVTFADFSSRELPLQSALCAFDCAQVLAEWVSTVQERVGRYLGILGRDDIDFTEVPGIMLMGDKDLRILEKINEVLTSAETKLADSRPIAADMLKMEDCGYGSKILLVHARMFEKAAVWPVTREMSQSLRVQAAHIKEREEASINPST